MSTLRKISLNGVAYDIGGETYPLYQVYDNHSDPRDFLNTEEFTTLAKNVFDDISQNISPIIFVKQDLSAYYRGTYILGSVSYSDEKLWSVYFNKISTDLSSSISADGNAPSISTTQISITYNTSLNDGTVLSKNWYRTTGQSTYHYLPTNTNATTAGYITFTPTQDSHPATKKYVDDSVADFIPFYDSGYYMTPTRWTIVSELPAYPANNTLYFVSPDYVEQYINTHVTSNGFNSGVTWSHITNLFMKTDDHTNVVETWQNTAPNSGSQYTNWQVHAPKYDVAVGATPNFTNTNSEDLYMHGVLEQRDPQTTALRYSAYLNVESNLASGTTYYFDSDDYDTPTVSGAIPIYIPGSTSFYYTIGTNGGLACLKGDTPIKTKGNKTKQIKNIEVGDVVTDAEGNGTEVIKIYKHTIPETYNITLSNGDTLVASPCHKFSIKGRYRYACQVVKDHKLDRGDGSTFDVTATEVKQEEMEVYEILTKSGTYTLANGIICECEAI